MPTTIGKKTVATTGSGHGAVGTPAVNNNPPTPPAGPVPTPYIYTSRSSTAKGTESALEVGGHPVLVKGSTMEMDKPGNQPARPTVGDIVTGTVSGVSVMQSGSSNSTAGGKPICTTGDAVTMNHITKEQAVSQVNTVLLGAADFAASTASGGGAGGGGRHGNAAMPPAPAKKAGGASAPEGKHATTEGHPVDVVSGAVVDTAVDFALPGLIPLIWRRSYASTRAWQGTSLGKGGWTHPFEQWIAREDDLLVLRAQDGRDIYFAQVEPGQSTFHRRERLTLTADRYGGFAVQCAATRLVRRFSALVPGGRAMLQRLEDAWGNAIRLAYEGEVLTRIVDTAGREIRLGCAKRGRIERIEIWARGALQQWVDCAYHPSGELASVTNALGFSDQYEYDGHHRMTRTTLKNGVSFHYQYDPDTDFCVKTWGDGGLHLIDLDPDFKQRTTLISGTEEAKTYTWNTQGFPAQWDPKLGIHVT